MKKQNIHHFIFYLECSPFVKTELVLMCAILIQQQFTAKCTIKYTHISVDFFLYYIDLFRYWSFLGQNININNLHIFKI